MTADGLDLTAALAWAASVAGPVVDVQELEGGFTSTMLALTTGGGRDDAVLRLMTREPWRTHGEGLTTRESQVQEMLAGTPVPAPRSLALDASGRFCGHPAHLMSLLPGRVETSRVDPVSLDRLAALLGTVHEVVPTREVRAFQSWAWEAKFNVPDWAADSHLWERAFVLLRSEPPEFEPCFIHRDFQHRNVLWSEGQVSGVVDWVETSIGPAWLDVAHCCTSIAIGHSNDAADLFADTYVEQTGRVPQPYFDVMDIVGWLPPPGREAFFKVDGMESRRLEERLQLVMSRAGS